MDFIYNIESKKSFDETVVSVLKAVDKKGWTLFQIYDIKERLAAKGFEHNSLKIIEICSAKHANKFLSKNTLVSLCMPCRINVLEENGMSRIIAVNPFSMKYFFPDIKDIDVEELSKEIKEIMDNSR